MSIEYARIRLELWGDWARENPAREVGYPTCSIEHRMMFGAGGRGFEPENKPAEEVDLIVREMEEEMRDLAKYYYVRRWSTREMSRRLHINRTTLDKQLHGVLCFVAGRLTI